MILKNKTMPAIVSIFIMLLPIIAYSSVPTPGSEVPVSLEIAYTRSSKPGDIINIDVKATALSDVHAMGVKFKADDGSAVIGNDIVKFAGPLKEGETRKVNFKIKLISSPVSFRIIPFASWTDKYGDKHKEDINNPVMSHSVNLLLDKKTGTMLTPQEITSRVEYHFDPVYGDFSDFITYEEFINKNLYIIDHIKSFEPSLNDSEALVVYRDARRYWYCKAGRSAKRASEAVLYETAKQLIANGWMVKIRIGENEKWLEKERNKNKIKKTAINSVIAIVFVLVIALLGILIKKHLRNK